MKLIRFAMPVIAALSMAATATAETYRYLMTIEGVNTVPFIVQSFSWGMSNPVTLGPGGGLSTGRVSISSFNIMKTFDGNSTALANACANGLHFDNARVRGYRGTSVIPFMDLYLEDVMVESQQWSASSNQAPPMESVSFAFAKVTLNGVLLSPEILANAAAMNKMMASMLAAPAKPTAKKASKISVR